MNGLREIELRKNTRGEHEDSETMYDVYWLRNGKTVEETPGACGPAGPAGRGLRVSYRKNAIKSGNVVSCVHVGVATYYSEYCTMI